MRLINAIGTIIAVLGIVFLLKVFAAIDIEQVFNLPIDRLLMIACFSIIFYTALLVCVAKGFAQLLSIGGVGFVTFEQSLAVWGKANIAKYLPSNLLHFAGRQVLGAAYRWPQTSIALASILEILLQVVVPGSLVVVSLALVQRLDILSDVLWLIPLVIVTVIVLVLAFLRGHSWGRIDKYLPKIFKIRMSPRPLQAFAFAASWYFLFFIGMCIIVSFIYYILQNSSDDAELLTLSAVFLISWVIGFVIPGAPGGIGVREGSFAMLGSVFFSVESLVIVALLMRLITLAGEALLFFVAVWFDHRTQAPAASPSSALPAHEQQRH